MKPFLLLLSLFTFTVSSAQLFEDIDDVLAATTEDAKRLIDAYVSPLGQSLTYSLNGGWASSAKTHKKFGFDLTFGAVSPSVSDAAKTFAIDELNLQQLTYSESTASTIFGANRPTTFNLSTTGSTQTEVTLPGGIEEELILNSLPIPYVQAGVGLFFDTDVMIRYIPKIKNKGAEYGLLGAGVKHNLMQYFGLLDKLPLNISALAAFSKIDVDYQLNSLNPDQKVSYDVSTFIFQALASLDFPVISVVGGIGYGKGDVTMLMLGNYTSINPNLPKDPININNTYTGSHAMIGLRANLLFLKLFANYTLQEFNTLNAGVSFSFR